jgi:hypothetical protein
MKETLCGKYKVDSSVFSHNLDPYPKYTVISIEVKELVGLFQTPRILEHGFFDKAIDLIAFPILVPANRLRAPGGWWQG